MVPFTGNLFLHTVILGKRGLDETKAKKVKIKAPSPTLPAYPILNLAPLGALTKTKGLVRPGLT
jgi:hypothetical protein